MGFKVKAVEKETEVTIPLTVNTFEEDEGGQPITVEVRHTLTIPNTFAREKHQQLQVKVRGKNVKAQGTLNANFWLWSTCMKSVEGYDDLPSTKEEIVQLFENSDILRIHAEKAAEALLNYLDASEGDILKKVRAIFRALIWGAEDRDPMEGDIVKEEMNSGAENFDALATLENVENVENVEDIEEIETPDNPLLDEVLDFYDCTDLLPLAQRIIWLSYLKECCGIIPQCIDIDYEELKLLVVLQEEQSKKMSYENYKMNQENKRSNANLAQMVDK